jgi:pyruvate formate lyase activating enzyme
MAIPEDRLVGQVFTPKDIVQQALQSNCESIAYTYTEPTIFYEFMLEVAKLAHRQRLKNVLVTNGYITREPLQTLSPYLDAVNVDLKFFSNEFYKKLCKARLRPVLHTLKRIKKLGVRLEATTLIVPTLNDTYPALEKIAAFIVDLGKETPWHVSGFHPTYKFQSLPPTSRESLYRAWEVGQSAGLKYVYIGNTDEKEFETTYCPGCGNSLVRRQFNVVTVNLIYNSRCPFCGTTIDSAGITVNTNGWKGKSTFGFQSLVTLRFETMRWRIRNS